MMFRMIRIGQYFENLIITIDTTAIFRGACSLAANAFRVLDALLFQKNAFKKNIMGPTITEIVIVNCRLPGFCEISFNWNFPPG